MKRVLLSFLAGLLPLAAFALDARLVLRPEAETADGSLRLGTLVEVQCADPSAADAIRAHTLGAAPMSGQRQRIRRSELTAALTALTARYGVTLHWEGAESVQVSRLGFAVSAERLQQAAFEAVHAVHAAAYEKLESRLAAPLEAVLAPSPAVQLRARRLQRPLSARTVIWVDVIVDGAIYRAVAVPLAVEAWRPVWRARRALASGEALRSEDFAAEVQDVLALRQTPFAGGQLEGRLRQALQVGEVVSESAVAPAGAVLPGDRTILRSQVGGITVERTVEVRSAAAPGQRVRVAAGTADGLIDGIVLANGQIAVEGK